MRQRGFIAMGYLAIGAAVVIGGLALALKIQTNRLDDLRDEYEAFKAKTEALGKLAQKEADRKTYEASKAKEKADAENKLLTANLGAAVKRLRDERASRNFLPAATAAAGSPESRAADRAELERALRTLDTGVQGLVDEGSKAVIDLNTAKEWARSLR